VSNTLEESPKAIESEKRYNKRVTEGKLAAKLVAKGLGVPAWRGITTFRHLQETMQLPSPGNLLPAVEKFLAPGAYSPAAAAAAFGEPLPPLFEGDDKKAGALRVLGSIGEEEAAFELLKRARHVCSEAERVFQLQAACGGEGGAGGAEAQLARMGRLLSESHASCRDDYECSSPGLNALTELAVASGAYGSRLTGAGWGGCAVSLVSTAALPAFLKAMEAGYYAGRNCNVATALFASAPGSGAAVYLLPSVDDL
jgi:N-acetylgalactosamine kinase